MLINNTSACLIYGEDSGKTFGDILAKVGDHGGIVKILPIVGVPNTRTWHPYHHFSWNQRADHTFQARADGDGLFSWHMLPSFWFRHQRSLVIHTLLPVFLTVQSVGPEGRTGRTAGGSLSCSEPMDRHGEMGLGPDTLPAPVGPYGVCYLDLFCLYAQKLQVNDFIPLMVYYLANCVAYV